MGEMASESPGFMVMMVHLNGLLGGRIGGG